MLGGFWKIFRVLLNMFLRVLMFFLSGSFDVFLEFFDFFDVLWNFHVLWSFLMVLGVFMF